MTEAPVPSVGRAPLITLNGPFGAADREPADRGAPWPDASALEELDTYVRSAPLTVTLVDPDLTFSDWTVSVTPALSPGTDQALDARPYPDPSPEQLRIIGPARGEWLLRADVTAAGRAAASYFWHLTVPDRDPPADGHVIVPAPDMLLESAGASVEGVAGSGCYVDTCSDVARIPPARELHRLNGVPANSLTLTLGDGSRFVRWSASATPIGDVSGAEPMTLNRDRDPAGVDHAILVVPPPGDWYVSVTITFDRRRGSYTYYARLTVP